MLSICLAYHYSVVWEFKTLHKRKTTDLHLQNRSLKFCRIKRLKPRLYRGFHGLYLFYSLLMVRVEGLEPPASCSQSRRATNCATPGYGAPYAFLAVGFTIITQNWEVRKSILPQNYLLNLKCWQKMWRVLKRAKKSQDFFDTLKRRHIVCRRFSYSSSLANPPSILSFISPVRALL